VSALVTGATLSFGLFGADGLGTNILVLGSFLVFEIARWRQFRWTLKMGDTSPQRTYPHAVEITLNVQERWIRDISTSAPSDLDLRFTTIGNLMTTLALPITTHLTSAALPGSGAYTNQSVLNLVTAQTTVTAIVTYTRGTSGGFPRFKPMWTFASTEAQATTLEGTIDNTTSPPLGIQQLDMWAINGPKPADGTSISFTLSFDVQQGATAFRLLAAEAGQTGTPGTCAILLSGSKDS